MDKGEIDFVQGLPLSLSCCAGHIIPAVFYSVIVVGTKRRGPPSEWRRHKGSILHFHSTFLVSPLLSAGLLSTRGKLGLPNEFLSKAMPFRKLDFAFGNQARFHSAWILYLKLHQKVSEGKLCLKTIRSIDVVTVLTYWQCCLIICI